MIFPLTNVALKLPSWQSMLKENQSVSHRIHERKYNIRSKNRETSSHANTSGERTTMHSEYMRLVNL